MIKINQIRLPIDSGIKEIKAYCSRNLKMPSADITDLRILKRSIEARKKEKLAYVYNVSLCLKNEEAWIRSFRDSRSFKKYEKDITYPYSENVYSFPYSCDSETGKRPVIIGSGPAGLFCAYELAKAGFRPLVLERGSSVEIRRKKVNRFWEQGLLDTECNVQFGEGGAGTFSDGKLNGGKADREGRSMEVLRLFNACGAPEEILYDAMPHIGTDILEKAVKNLREKIISFGGTFLFDTKAEKIVTENGCLKGVITSKGERITADHAVFAIGHSARDTFSMLHENGVTMEQKPFAVGLRIIHDQELINRSQWGDGYPGKLGSAYYKLTYRTKSQRSVYSFCMCPGGYVVNASSEEGRTAINGMSYSGRASGFANSAIVAAITPDDYKDQTEGDVLSGIRYQRKIEKRAYEASDGKIPVMYFTDFCGEESFHENSLEKDAFKGKAAFADIRNVLPENLREDICEAVKAFDKKIEGFASEKTLVCAVESRTSSPVRIIRDESFQSSIKGLYPCGEGAGYAGGIMSAAVDGIKTAEALAKNMSDMLR